MPWTNLSKYASLFLERPCKERGEIMKSQCRAIWMILYFVCIALILPSVVHGQAHDNLLCFRAPDTVLRKFKADIRSVMPELNQMGCTLNRVVGFCAPATKENVYPPAGRPDIVGETAGFFVQYSIKCPRIPMPSGIQFSDSLGIHVLLRPLAQTILVPAVLGSAYPQKLFVMIGDSTTVSATYFSPNRIDTLVTADTLQYSLLWQSRDYEVMMLALPGLKSSDWSGVPDPDTCTYWNNWSLSANDAILARVPGVKVMLAACRNQTPMIDNILEVTGRMPDVALIVLGANDKFSAEETVQNLQTIKDSLDPSVITLIASPFRAYNDLQPRLAEIANLLRAYGMLTGPDFNGMDLPTIYDGVHLTTEGAMSAAVAWLNAIEPFF